MGGGGGAGKGAVANSDLYHSNTSELDASNALPRVTEKLLYFFLLSHFLLPVPFLLLLLPSATVLKDEEGGGEEEEEEGLFKADAVKEEDPERDRATQV